MKREKVKMKYIVLDEITKNEITKVTKNEKFQQQ
jgi:hypothetical protein